MKKGMVIGIVLSGPCPPLLWRPLASGRPVKYLILNQID